MEQYYLFKKRRTVMLLKNNANVNEKHKDGATPLL